MMEGMLAMVSERLAAMTQMRAVMFRAKARRDALLAEAAALSREHDEAYEKYRMSLKQLEQDIDAKFQA